MKALSIRQPWAWLIAEGFKPLENRTWKSDFRGRIWIHASKGLTQAEYLAAVTFARRIDPTANIPSMDRLKRGGLIGQADVTDCINRSTNQWFQGPYAFVLAKPYPLPFLEYPGQLGFFDVQL